MAESKRVLTVWVTKYALTKGLFQEEVEFSDDGTYVYCGTGYGRSIYYLGKTAFETKDEAIQNVRQQIAAKRKSLNNALKKLQKLESEL